MSQAQAAPQTRTYDPFAALGNAREAAPSNAAVAPPRIGFPWVSSGISAACLVLAVMAFAGKSFAGASALLSLAAVFAVIAIATHLFHRIELRLIDIQYALRDRRV